MLCDRHDIRLDELVDLLLKPFAILFAISMVAIFAFYKIRSRRLDISFTVSVAASIGFLTYQMPVLAPAIPRGYFYEPLNLVFPIVIMWLPSLLISPLLIGICVWSRRASAAGKIAAPVTTLLLGLLANYLWLNSWTNTC
jgi:hypothetical protein